MTVLKYITDILFSIRTTIWSLWFLIAMLLAGAVVMPAKEEFQTIHSMPLFDWLSEQSFIITWWLWASIAVLILLALNTLLCSVQSVLKKRGVSNLLLILSPQIIHAAFLLMLLAHLLSSSGGFKEIIAAGEGAAFQLNKDGVVLVIERIEISADPAGYMSDWGVDIVYTSGGKQIKRDRIMPNRPSLYEDFNINVKDLRAFPQKAALVQISREPGALWALAGGVLFMLGIMTLVILRVKTSRD
ncbi:MAG: hypothetical protein EPN22_08330 [Nitrospirae bacterium]|nr:MAG: hypothetical protein EPN22_08330 [Nitrospirota bacterium]